MIEYGIDHANDRAMNRTRRTRGSRTRAGAAALLTGLVLVVAASGCASLNQAELEASDTGETALERSTRLLLQEFTAYPIGLERTWDHFSTGLSEDFETTRDTITGVPGYIADDFRNGWEASTAELARISNQAAQDTRDFPRNVRRFWKLIQ